MRIDSSQIYSLIFRSWTNSFSYLPQFHFVDIIPIPKYNNLTNIIPIHEYFSKYSWLPYSYIEYIKSMNTSHYGFVCPVNLSNEKYIRVKEFFKDIFLRKNRYEVFENYLQILPIWQILFLFLFASFGIHKLFLFLLVQKLALQIYSYSYLREIYYLLITVTGWCEVVKRCSFSLKSRVLPFEQFLLFPWKFIVTRNTIRNNTICFLFFFMAVRKKVS